MIIYADLFINLCVVFKKKYFEILKKQINGAINRYKFF